MTKSTGATGDDKLIGDGDKDQNDLDQKRLNMDEGLKHGDNDNSDWESDKTEEDKIDPNNIEFKDSFNEINTVEHYKKDAGIKCGKKSHKYEEDKTEINQKSYRNYK